jgi:hypothetical protein
VYCQRQYIGKISRPCKENGNYFREFSIEHKDKNKNVEADELVKAAARNFALLPNVVFQTIEDSSVKTIKLEPRMLNMIQGED